MLKELVIASGGELRVPDETKKADAKKISTSATKIFVESGGVLQVGPLTNKPAYAYLHRSVLFSCRPVYGGVFKIGVHVALADGSADEVGRERFYLRSRCDRILITHFYNSGVVRRAAADLVADGE